MSRNFKLTGGIPAKLAQIEKILPRIMAKMGTKTFGIIPDSVLSMYNSSVIGANDICRCAMFKGKVKKILFHIDLIEGKEKPKYSCTIENGNELQRIAFETNKLSYTMDVNILVDDGAIITLRQENPDVNLSNVYVTALVALAQDSGEIQEFITDELIKSEESDEGI